MDGGLEWKDQMGRGRRGGVVGGNTETAKIKSPLRVSMQTSTVGNLSIIYMYKSDGNKIPMYRWLPSSSVILEEKVRACCWGHHALPVTGLGGVDLDLTWKSSRWGAALGFEEPMHAAHGERQRTLLSICETNEPQQWLVGRDVPEATIVALKSWTQASAS